MQAPISSPICVRKDIMDDPLCFFLAMPRGV